MAGGRNQATRTPPASSLTSAPGKIELAARHKLKPYAQGSLDGLCTIYAIVNALRLALADQSPLSKSQCKDLFAAGAELLDRNTGFVIAATIGVRTKPRLALARHLAKLASTTDWIATVERPDHSTWRSIDDVLAWIAASLLDEAPVILTILGGLNHLTVVSGITPGTLQLFDGGQRFIRKTSLGFRAGFYRVPPNGLLRIAVQRTR